MSNKVGVALVATIMLAGIFLVIVLIVAYGGVVNVAADQENPPGVDWFLEETQESSVRARAKDVNDREMNESPPAHEIDTGLAHFQEMCVTCHGAPGVPASEIGKGLNPSPPDLVESRMKPAENFWIIKHGIRMTGMPSFGKTHSDDKIWAIVAFLQELPQLDAKEYSRRVRRVAETSSGHSHTDDSTAQTGEAETPERSSDRSPAHEEHEHQH